MLTNAGTVTMTGAANMTVYNNNSTYLGGVYNLAAALWDIQTNANIYCACYGNEFFNNAGTFRKSGGSSQATVAVAFTNTGTVTNLIAILSFNGGGSITGIYGTAAGATIDFGGGSFTMGVPPTITGLGICEFTGTTLTLTQNWPTNLVLASGSLILGPAFQNSGGITNLTLSGVTLASTNRVTRYVELGERDRYRSADDRQRRGAEHQRQCHFGERADQCRHGDDDRGGQHDLV